VTALASTSVYPAVSLKNFCYIILADQNHLAILDAYILYSFRESVKYYLCVLIIYTYYFIQIRKRGNRRYNNRAAPLWVAVMGRVLSLRDGPPHAIEKRRVSVALVNMP
jgi:hypothetical protein